MLGFRENVADPLKSPTPEPVELGKQRLRFGNRTDVGLHHELTAMSLQVDQSSLLKHRNVLLNRGRAHRVHAGQSGHRKGAVHRPAHEVAPGSVRQRPKYAVGASLLGGRAIYNHSVVRYQGGGPGQRNGGERMRLTVTTNISVDGVMQGLGRDDEDRRGGFERGGWVIALTAAEDMDHVNEVYGRATAFLFGRQTYEIFARSWGAVHEMMASPVGVALNGRPKYVVSTTLTDPRWSGTSVLSGDIAGAIRDLKARQDGEIVVPGSGVLVRWLLANGLVDQFDLLIYPVILGQGTRLFPDSGSDMALDLIDSRTTSRGVTIQTYRAAGRPKYAMSAIGANT